VSARYDAIGTSYAQTRREDPRIAARLAAALGAARTVVNVGAGTGSYEPAGRHVIAVEPSAVMIAQRGPGRVPAIQCSAGRLPLIDDSVDAAMAIITVHHWDAELEAGVRELRRVARGPVVVLTYDPRVSGRMWLMADYLPEVAALDDRIFPAPERVADWLGGDTGIEAVPIHRDTPDWMLGSFWAHPERVLDPVARAGTSGFQRMGPAVVERVVRAVERDLADGTWDARHGHLRTLDEHDVGLRLIVSR
jgi:SAM-dependent methyltransferase